MLLITRRVELVGKKEFAAAALNPEYETYVVHVVSLSSALLVASLDVYLSQRPQIFSLIAGEAPTKFPAEYTNFTDVFFLDLATEHPEYTEINTHVIDLEKSKQPSYGPIYSLGPVKLETLKTYIEINMANSFIRPSKSSASAPILFDKKPDGNFYLCIDYWGLNNITIKNRYWLLLVDKSLDRLGHVKQFIQLDMTISYHQMRIKEGDKWKTAFRTWYGHFEY